MNFLQRNRHDMTAHIQHQPPIRQTVVCHLFQHTEWKVAFRRRASEAIESAIEWHRKPRFIISGNIDPLLIHG
jgi:hypothetical protein